MPLQLIDLVSAHWQTVFHNTLDAIVLINDATHLVEANPAACRLLGYSRDELLGLTIFAITPPENQAQTDAIWRQFVAQGTSQREYVVRRKDGTICDVEYRAVANVLPGLHLSVFHDITDRKRAERQLIRYTRGLEAMGDIDGAILAARTSHDVAQAIVSHIQRIVVCKLACAVLFDHESRVASVIATRAGGDKSPSRYSADLLGDLDDLRQGQTRVVADLPKVRKPAPLVDALRRAGAGAYAAFPILCEGELVAVLVLGVADRAEIAGDRLTLAGQLAQHFAVALRGTRLFEEVRQGRGRLKELSRQLIKSQEAERLHIARELHDVIGQALAVTRINLDVLKQAFSDQRSRDLVRETVSMIEEALAQARNLSLDLRPSLLDELGLGCAIRAYLDRQSLHSGCTVECIVAPDFGRLSPEVETACFRVMQEAVTNIVRHAGATRVEVELRQEAGGAQMEVRDNGAGFDLKAAQEQVARGESMGLLGMQERVSLAGGTIEFKSAPRQGSSISVTFPVTEALPRPCRPSRRRSKGPTSTRE